MKPNFILITDQLGAEYTININEIAYIAKLSHTIYEICLTNGIRLQIDERTHNILRDHFVGKVINE